jgi:hypothetical protein
MADNVAITAGSGTSISTDDAGANGQVQRVKLTYSADGDATHIGADANGLDADVTRIAGKTPAYTEGDTDASIDGVPILWEDTSDTLRPASAAKPLPVNIISGSSSGVQYDEGNTDATITGTAILWEDTADTLRAASAAKPLPVNIITGSSSGTQYTEADVDTTITGTAVMWEDTGDTLRAASVAKPLPVQAPAAARSTHSIAVALQSDAIMNALTTLTPKFFTETVVSADTDEELIAAVGGKKLRILALAVQVAATATTVTFESSTTTRKHRVPAGANGGQILPFNPVGWFETATGESLTCTLTAGSDADISGVYVEV